MNRRGQAIVELALFGWWLILLFGATLSFTKWLLVREKLISGVREATMLYSSGHLSQDDTARVVRASLAQGWPAIGGDRLTIDIHRDARWGRLFNLDVITLSYKPDGVLGRYFKKEMSERCVIKHSPNYDLPLTGPPVPW